MKIIIIGGVAGGATTAARIRRVDETAEIILLEKGKHISYANCGLPYYIGGVIEEREKLFVQTPEAFSTRFRVDVRTENEVIFIDRKKKTVTVRQSSEDTYEESYDKLLISTGASPVITGNRPSGYFHAKKCHRYRPYQRIYQQPFSPKSGSGRSRIYRSRNGREPARTRGESLDCGNGESGNGSYRLFDGFARASTPDGQRSEPVFGTSRSFFRTGRERTEGYFQERTGLPAVLP